MNADNTVSFSNIAQHDSKTLPFYKQEIPEWNHFPYGLALVLIIDYVQTKIYKFLIMTFAAQRCSLRNAMLISLSFIEGASQKAVRVNGPNVSAAELVKPSVSIIPV